MSEPRPACVVIAGGGTGGHLIPGLAVARELAADGMRVVFVGTARGIEARLVPPAGFDLRLIPVAGLKNVGWRSAVRAVGMLPRAVWRSGQILRASSAHAVLGIGGYASGPVLLAAALRRLPIVALEVNARTGLANRWAARWVRAAAVNFPETARDFRHAVVTGVPVRSEFFRIPPPVHRGTPQLLAFGGSQGARALNRALVEAARIWNAKGSALRLTHQTGGREYNDVLRAYEEAGIRIDVGGATPADGVTVTVTDFIEDMAAAMADADLVIGRSGASTLAELAAAGRAALLVPFPGAADDHQWHNARAYERSGAALMLPQADLTGERLAREVETLLAAPARLAAMEQSMRTWAHPGAATAIAQLLRDTIYGDTAGTPRPAAAPSAAPGASRAGASSRTRP